MSTASLQVRILISAPVNLGPGKVRLLQAIGETGSISGAARQLQISYRRAWLMVDALNHVFPVPLVTASAGGVKGGGAQLSSLGQAFLERYQHLQMKAERLLAAESADLLALLTSVGEAS
jgi:molybdate transport system regulatory protein